MCDFISFADLASDYVEVEGVGCVLTLFCLWGREVIGISSYNSLILLLFSLQMVAKSIKNRLFLSFHLIIQFISAKAFR